MRGKLRGAVCVAYFLKSPENCHPFHRFARSLFKERTFFLLLIESHFAPSLLLRPLFFILELILFAVPNPQRKENVPFALGTGVNRYVANSP